MIFAVYKPKGPTSNDVLNRIRKAAGTRKVGHAGTLDPLAEGVLIVGIGREDTKQLATEVAKEKEYHATIKLGVVSTTDDEEGKKEYWKGTVDPGESTVQKVVKSFVGTITQTPPLYSAVKISGKEAYKYARKGKPVSLEAREVLIKKIDILAYQWPFLKLRVVTGPGVYIRALARDIGEKLSVGGYLAGLIRTRVGTYTQENALPLEEVVNFVYDKP